MSPFIFTACVLFLLNLQFVEGTPSGRSLGELHVPGNNPTRICISLIDTEALFSPLAVSSVLNTFQIPDLLPGV